MTATYSHLPSSLVTKIQSLIEPDIAEMKAWSSHKINAAKEAGLKNQSEEAQ